MIIKTKFNIGDKVFTIDTTYLKVREFEVNRINAFTVGDTVNVRLYDSESYNANGYDENKCFHTEAELMTFITTKEDAKTL